jgi:hypothetical protein
VAHRKCPRCLSAERAADLAALAEALTFNMVADARNGESSPSRCRVPSGSSPLLGRMTVRIWPPTLELPRSESHDAPASRSANAEESAAAGPVRKGLSSPLRNLREKASHVRDEYVKQPLRATAVYVGETRVVGEIRDTAEYVGERASHVKDEYVKEPLRATAEYVGETRVVTKVRETAEYVGETRVVTTIRELLPERRWSVPRWVTNCPSAGGVVHPRPARLPPRCPQPSRSPCSAVAGGFASLIGSTASSGGRMWSRAPPAPREPPVPYPNRPAFRSCSPSTLSCTRSWRSCLSLIPKPNPNLTLTLTLTSTLTLYEPDPKPINPTRCYGG